MSANLAGMWIRTEPAVEVLRLTRTGGRYTATIDRPAAMRFREPIEVVAFGSPTGISGACRDRLEIAGSRVIIVASDGARTQLRRGFQPSSALLGKWCGWYEAGGRTVLLTQFPEEHFGDPMCLIQEGDAVVRAYPLSQRCLVREDGDVIELQGGNAQGRPALRLGGDRGLVLPKSDRYLEHEITFTVGALTLSGTLVVPADPGPHPAAVMVHGSVGGQREYWRLFAGAVLDAGVAVLIYDKQSHGCSGGTAEPTIFDQADALSAALDVLSNEPDLDPGRLGLIGFSNGMWAVPMAAARRSDVAFIAGVGSPGVTMAESEVHRRTRMLRDAGVDAETVTAVAEAWRCVFAIAAAGHAPEELTARLTMLLAELSAAPDLQRYEIPEYARRNPMLSPVPPTVPVTDLVAMIAGEPHPELTYDPAADYRKLRCPVFLQYGAEDTSVPPDASRNRIAVALRESREPRSAIHVYPNLEHQLNIIPAAVTGITPEEATYGFHGFRYGQGVRADLTTWLRSTMGSTST